MGEKGEATMETSFTERFGSGGARNQGSPMVAVQKERAKKEERKEEGLGLNKYRDKSASLVGVLCVTRAPARPLESGWIHRAPPSLTPFYALGLLGWLAPYAWV
jgi:hypothetical protein